MLPKIPDLLSMRYQSSGFTPTHRGVDNNHLVRAWHYLSTASIPLWVVNNFHNLGNGKLTHRSGYAVPEGDWIIDLGGSAIVLTDAEFQKCFQPEPVKP